MRPILAVIVNMLSGFSGAARKRQNCLSGFAYRSTIVGRKMVLRTSALKSSRHQDNRDLLDHSAFRLFDETYQGVHVLASIRL